MHSTIITQSLQCECNPNKIAYASRQSFSNHFTTDKHQVWQLRKENRTLREKIVKLENELTQLKYHLSMIYKKNDMEQHQFVKIQLDKLD
jgi:uncharacterized coiled-coil DUF342 family protein